MKTILYKGSLLRAAVSVLFFFPLIFPRPVHASIPKPDYSMFRAAPPEIEQAPVESVEGMVTSAEYIAPPVIEKTSVVTTETRSACIPLKPQPSTEEILSYIRKVFGANSEVALAVSHAENGNRQQTRMSPTDDWGIFQINHRWHPQYSLAQLCTWDFNIEKAYEISSGGTNWNAWSTYKSGAYKQFLGVD